MLKKLILILAVAIVAAPLLARLISQLVAQGREYDDLKAVPRHHVAIVFGAGVRNGLPTPMLYDRVASAVDLYKAGVVDKLLMSGDNRYIDYNEPAVMRRTATQLGVPDRDIVMDYAGRSTYDTCYRARDIFGLSDAVLVTQRFHLDRALMTCNSLGVRAVGYVADRRVYSASLWWNKLREIPATLNAFVELYITKPLPVLGERVAID
ncbi:MAG: YdcF family protein [Chloroflexi bacterium]|nr:YdcF family protein [Chloroflexota bacterium]MCL5273126.1 YdcF family protein [Chloroflexota bacterium]